MNKQKQKKRKALHFPLFSDSLGVSLMRTATLGKVHLINVLQVFCSFFFSIFSLGLQLGLHLCQLVCKFVRQRQQIWVTYTNSHPPLQRLGSENFRFQDAFFLHFFRFTIQKMTFMPKDFYDLFAPSTFVLNKLTNEHF